MNNNQISQKQGVSAVVLFIIGSSSLLVMGLEAKMDIWAAILLAGVAGTLIMLVYTRLLTVLPGRDFFDTMEYFFGKIGSKVFILLLTWFSFNLCAIVLRNYGQFVVTVGLPETPMCVTMFIMLLIIIISVRRGIEVIGRWSEVFVLFITAFLLISVLIMSQNMDINNLLPMFDNGVGPILKGAFGVTTFPFAETVAFLLVFPAFKKGASVKKVFLRGLLIGGSIIFITSLADMMVLGTSISENVYFPTYAAMACTHYGDFLHRFEIIATIVFITAVFLKLSILLLGACKGTARLLGLPDYKPLVVPVALLVICSAINSFDSMINFHEWTFSVFPYYATVFQIITPLVALILIEIKIRRSKKETLTKKRRRAS